MTCANEGSKQDPKRSETSEIAAKCPTERSEDLGSGSANDMPNASNSMPDREQLASLPCTEPTHPVSPQCASQGHVRRIGPDAGPRKVSEAAR